MGTVIIYENKAYVFREMEPGDAVTAFLANWYSDAEGFMVVPLAGIQEGNSQTSVVGFR